MFCIHKITQTIAENKEMWVETKIVDGIFVDYVGFSYICTYKNIQGISVLPATYIKATKVSLNNKTNAIMKNYYHCRYVRHVCCCKCPADFHPHYHQEWVQRTLSVRIKTVSPRLPPSQMHPTCRASTAQALPSFTTGVCRPMVPCVATTVCSSLHAPEPPSKSDAHQLNALVLKGTKKTTIAGNSVIIPRCCWGELCV